MGLFQLNINNKTLFIFITSVVWAINFRTSFKAIDNHMDSGSYSSLKFDLNLIFIKNILNCLFFIGFILETILFKSTSKKEKKLVKTVKGNMLIMQLEEKKTDNDSLLRSVSEIHQLNNKRLKIKFWLKNFCIIVIIYIIEELYFIISNNHI